MENNGIKKNTGKIFEKSFINSIDNRHVLIKRLNDNAAAFSGGNNTRFSSTNECDYILFEINSRTFYGLEMKTVGGNSLTFWREDFEDKKGIYMIKKCQILGLSKWAELCPSGVFGFLINFRSHDNQTFFISINNFINYTSTLSKKSINYNDVLKMNPIVIENKIIRVNYKYDVEKFLQETCYQEVNGI